MSKQKRECPVCRGVGEIEAPYIEKTDKTEANSQIVKTLHESGYSFRQIQKALGFKSVRSVQYLLKRK